MEEKTKKIEFEIPLFIADEIKDRTLLTSFNTSKKQKRKIKWELTKRYFKRIFKLWI